MPAAKCVVSLLLLAVTFGATHLGAEDHGESLGEPLFRLIRELPEETGPVKAALTKAVDTSSRSVVVSFFNSEYTPSLSVPMQWTGNVAACAAGITSQAYVDATFQMINFYRGMAGLVDATNATSYNQNAQEAALMMSANSALSHDPPSNWTCWTSGGDAAAGASNLALGNAGPHAMIAYMRESGSFNYFVGHRRWILYPRRNLFGTGSVGETTTSANALYVFTSTVTRPPTPDKVAWPPEGYVPYQVVYPRWSLSLNTGAVVSFASADVSMTEGITPVSLSVVSRTDNGYGDNTIVWEPSGLSFTPGAQDRVFTVTVSDIMVNGTPQTEVFNVIVIDPSVVTDLIFSDGFESGNSNAWSITVP